MATKYIVPPNVEPVWTAVLTTSANWDNAFTALTATSGHWDSAYFTLTSVSGQWMSVYTNATANSATWEGYFCNRMIFVSAISGCAGVLYISADQVFVGSITANAIVLNEGSECAFCYSTATQTATANNVWFPIYFEKDVHHYGIVHIAGTNMFTVSSAGVYQVTTNISCSKTGGGVTTTAARVQRRGAEAEGSYHATTMTVNNTPVLVTRTYQFTLTAGEMFLIDWATDTYNFNRIVPGNAVGSPISNPSASVAIERIR